MEGDSEMICEFCGDIGYIYGTECGLCNSNKEQVRKDFEEWAVKERGYSIERFEEKPRQYVENNTHIAWVAWKASRQNLVVELPPTSGQGSSEELYYRNDILTALEEQGIKYK